MYHRLQYQKPLNSSPHHVLIRFYDSQNEKKINPYGTLLDQFS